MFKKICFFIIAGFFGIAIYYLNYQTDQYNHTLNIINTAIEEEKYSDVARVFGGYFDTETIIKDDSDKLDLRIYPGTTQVNVEYYKNDSLVNHYDFVKTYYFYLFKTNYSLATFTYGESEQINYSGIKFIGESNKEYMYYFVINDQINANNFVEKPTEIIQTMLNNDRDYVTTNDSLKFISINFTDLMIEEIVKTIESPITKLEIIDNENNVVYTQNVTLDFSEEFFKYSSEMITKYSDAIERYNEVKTTKEQEEVMAEFNEYYSKWMTKFEEDNILTYSFGFSKEELSPNSLYFESIDKLVIFLVILVLAYILLFHRYEIKVIVCKIFGKEPPLDNRVDETISETTIEDDMIDVDNPK